MPFISEEGTSALTLEEMEVALKRYGFDDTDPLAAWLNAAMHDLEDDFDWPWLEAIPSLVTMAVGSSTITLPEDTLKIITVKDLTNLSKLKFFNRHRFAREITDSTEIGLPEVYTLTGTNIIQIWRVLSSSVEFEIVYQARTPNLIEPEDVPTTSGNMWPANTSYPIVQRAAAIGLQTENEEERAKSAQEQFDKALERLRKKFAEQELDEPDTVQDVMEYGGTNGYLN